MAEAYMKKFGGDRFLVESAGLEAGKLNPLAVQVMSEDGIDISQNQTNDILDFFREGRIYHYVVTVCDEASAAKCPVFPGVHKKINWSFTDPSSLTGTHSEKLATTREVRDKIREKVIALLAELS
jgi:arsenate reductase